MFLTFTPLSYSSTADNFHSLPPELKDYFRHLAAGDPDRSAVQFFSDTVPVELQDDPELVDKYLNGDPELGVSDKDWSHDVSKANGGSDSADNGRFEDSSTNRSRGADNVTPEEAYAAEAESDEDVRTLLESTEDVADATVWAEAAELAGGAVEVGLDLLAPLVGGAVAAKAVADRFDTVEDKVGYGSLAGGATALFLVTPLGQVCVASYLGYRVVKRGTTLYKKHFAKA